MKRAGWLLSPFAAAIVATVTVAGTNHALGSAVVHQGTSATTVSPRPPVVGGKPGKHGVNLTAEQRRLQEQRRRLEPFPPPKSSHPPKQSNPRAKDPRVDPQRQIRLNIGMCGLVQSDGTVPGPTRCQVAWPEERETVAPEVVQPRPQDVTWQQIVTETKVVLFRGLSVKVQPSGRTLVNLDTIVYTDESKVSTTTVTMLGFPVQVEATPISYRWNFGDGTPPLTTSTPGKPYPSKEIIHKYLKRGAVNLTLTTNYAARFNVANTGWQYVAGAIPVTGPATPLLVREAVPVLVDPPN
jgi:hypothetical protein